MACSITISNVVATVSGANLSSLTVSGTITDCAEVDVTVTCGSSVIKKTAAGSTPTSSNWSATFSAAELANFPCTCGNTVRVDVQCRLDPLCNNWQLETIQCCPTVDIQVEQGDCKGDGTKPVTISATLTPAPNSTIPIQADLVLDGVSVQSGTGSSSIAILNLSHSGDLASGSHTACVQVNQPNCGSQCTTFAFECKTENGDGENSADCKKTYKKWFCPLVYTIMTLSFAIAIALLILGPCFSLSVSLADVGAGILVLALVAFVVFWLLCSKCLCGWIQKLLWRVAFTVGMVVTTFAGCCTTTFLLPGLVLIGVGIAFLLWWGHLCKKSLCDVLKEVLFVILAFVVPVIAFLLSFQPLQACLYVLIPIWSFTFYDLILVLLYSLILYTQSRC